jgi:RNA polymerase sigma factor (TIGR02999 family)
MRRFQLRRGEEGVNNGQVRRPSRRLAHSPAFPLSMPSDFDTLALLRARSAGDESVLDALFARMYGELREIARRRLGSFRPGDTLNTTALVNEAYLKLVDQGKAEPQDRTHFLALASRAMRFILVDHARTRSAVKRGGGVRPVSLDDIQLAGDERADDLLKLDDALKALAEADERLAQVVELRFFGGLSHEEIAQATGRSVPTVKRDWTRARAWLLRTMNEGA